MKIQQTLCMRQGEETAPIACFSGYHGCRSAPEGCICIDPGCRQSDIGEAHAVVHSEALLATRLKALTHSLSDANLSGCRLSHLTSYHSSSRRRLLSCARSAARYRPILWRGASGMPRCQQATAPRLCRMNGRAEGTDLLCGVVRQACHSSSR